MQKVEDKSIATKFAWVISFIFHPLLSPSYLLLILFNTNTHFLLLPFDIKRIIFLLVFLCTFLIPLSMAPFFIHLKLISNIRMIEHKERVIPLILGALSYFFAVFLLSKFHTITFEFIKSFMLSSGILVLLCAFISIKWKISAHLIGLGGLMAALYFYGINYISDFSSVLAITSLASGLTAFARLKLQAHTQAQVYTGFLLGFVGMLLLLVFV